MTTSKIVIFLTFFVLSECFVTINKSSDKNNASQNKPLYHGEQDYLQDVDNNGHAKQKRNGEITQKKMMEVSAITYKDNDNDGIYEFPAGGLKCKFYLGNRQVQRSLKCNEKKCVFAEEKGNGMTKWNCDGEVTCTVNVSGLGRSAMCVQDKHEKVLISAPIRCPSGKQVVNSKCRETFNR